RSTLGNCSPDGFRWQSLGTFTIQGATLVVQLTNRANGQVVADAVKIERVTTPPTPPAPPPKPNPDNHHDDHHDKGDDKKDHNGHGSNKPSPHKSDPHSSSHHGKSSPKPSPKHNDPSWLDGLAKDVAKHQGSKPRK